MAVRPFDLVAALPSFSPDATFPQGLCGSRGLAEIWASHSVFRDEWWLVATITHSCRRSPSIASGKQPYLEGVQQAVLWALVNRLDSALNRSR